MKSKVRIKKHFKKRKNSKFFVSYLLLIIFLIAGSFVYHEVTHQNIAKEWVEVSANKTKKIILPKDDAYHAKKMEWWYYNGHLITESGKEFSFHATVFLVNNLLTHTVFHVSLSDHQKQRHFIDQSRIGGNLHVGEKDNNFRFEQANWLISGSNGHDQIKIINDQFTLDLQLSSTQPVISHGQEGIISLGSAGSSYYYSRARMNVAGSIVVDGKKEIVTGISWFDHQWGDFESVTLSWDWFSLQLDDGVDLMLYQIRDKEGESVLYSGSISKDGKTEILNNADFELTPEQHWVSDKTRNSYPVVWDLKIPKKGIDLTIKSIVNNSEFDANLTTYLIYWEGAVNVEGSHTGQGFMELNGYGPENK